MEKVEGFHSSIENDRIKKSRLARVLSGICEGIYFV
jgi:hypothetical protein